jgi:hypothetical protein
VLDRCRIAKFREAEPRTQWVPRQSLGTSILSRSQRRRFFHQGRKYFHFQLFNRDSQDIPESRRTPILAGMSGEERASVARHAILFESRLNNSLENQGHSLLVRCRTENADAGSIGHVVAAQIQFQR